MNKKILFGLALSWLVPACSYQMAAGPLKCKSYTSSMACTDLGNNPSVTVDIDALTVDPECIKAKKNGVIVVKLESKGKIEKNTVEIRPKNPNDDDWLAGTNTPNKNRIFLGVPNKGKNGKALPIGDHEYGIWTKNGCIDPRVNVQN